MNLENLNIEEIELETFLIDGYIFIFRQVNVNSAPLYWIKGDGITRYIYFNKSHPKSYLFNESYFLKLIAAMCRTSLTFSSEFGDHFLNRMKNYLDLI
jgi:hypothetical protein